MDCNALIVAHTNGKINFFKEQTEYLDRENAEFLLDEESSQRITNQIGLLGKGENLLEN